MFSPHRVANLLLAWSLSATAALAAAYEYDGKTTPQTSTPPWAMVQKSGTATLVEDGLRVETLESQRHFYGIGRQIDGEAWGDPAAWDFTGGYAQVVFRLRCEADTPEMEVFRLILRDGRQQWQVPFTSSTVFGKPAHTAEWDTYTAVVENGKLRLSSERQGLITENRKGSALEGHPGIFFGSYAFSKDGSQHPRFWELSFLRWTNEPSTSPAP